MKQAMREHDDLRRDTLRMAIAAYQKQEGLAPTGTMDAALAERFRAIG